MIRQSFVYDEQMDAIIPRPTDDSYRQSLTREREIEVAKRERDEALAHPGIYL